MMSIAQRSAETVKQNQSEAGMNDGIPACQCYGDDDYCSLHSQSSRDRYVKEKIKEMSNLPWGDGPYWRNAVLKLSREIVEKLDEARQG